MILVGFYIVQEIANYFLKRFGTALASWKNNLLGQVVTWKSGKRPRRRTSWPIIGPNRRDSRRSIRRSPTWSMGLRLSFFKILAFSAASNRHVLSGQSAQR